jgi:hypothetical protein
VLPGPPVSAPRCAASLARTPAAPRPLPPGPEVARPYLSAAPFRITHVAVLPCSQPAPTVPMRHAPPTAIGAAQSRRVHAVPIHVAKPWTPPPFSPPRSAEPPPLPSPASPSLLQKAPAAVPALSSLPPRSPPPTATRAVHAPLLLPPLIHADDRATAVLIAFRLPSLPFCTSTMRHAYPPPLPYLGPPSPLSSSPTARGASRSRHRPSLQ